MQVIIGVDPHKASHTAVAIDSSEVELASKKVRASRSQVEQLLDWAAPFPARLWAVEGAEGMGYLLAQQLVASGEHVCNVPATLAARARVLGTGRSNKNDPNDALSVAIAALRTPGLRPVERAGHGEVLRLLAKRNTDIGVSRKRVVCRIHALLVDLDPGGIAKEINASDVDRFLAGLSVTTPAAQVRYDLVAELLAEVRRLDEQLKASHKRLRDAVAATGTTLTDIYGVGPVLAAMLIGYSGDIGRFANQDRYAAYNGTAPVEFSSAGRVTHRLSRRGNRQLNHAVHMVAIGQLRQPHTDGRAYFDRRVAEGKTKKEALRALKRQISNTIYRHLVADALRARG
jgi:transposase